MSVETLQRLHGRYADLSSRFRAGWAFHQYAESLRRIFPGAPRPDLTAEFQAAYGSLKSISARLNAEDPGIIESELGSVGETLERLAAALAEEDSKLSPQAVRHFFQRVKNEDDKVLTQLVKFYAYAGGSGAWTEDRLDKLDFLMTRVAEERDAASDRYVLIERPRLRDLATGLWAMVGAEDPEDAEVEAQVGELRALRQAVSAAETLDQLNERRLVDRYRELKHGLGACYLFPKLLYEILDTNLMFKNLIRQLYVVEERRITADYQRVFDLEREVPVDSELDRELRSFRQEVEGFEQQLQGEELKLKDLAHIRRRIRALSERLDRESDASAQAPVAEVPMPVPAADAVASEEILSSALAHLDAALVEVDPELPARRAVLASEVYSLRLEPRELEAHRHLHGGGAEAGHELPRTIVEAAALRVAINRQVEEIRALLDDTAATGEAAVFGRARRTLRLATGYMARLAAAAEQATFQGDVAEAQALMVLRMRLVRDHAGAWLLAVRPLLSGS
jgi:hypothetical protein